MEMDQANFLYIYCIICNKNPVRLINYTIWVYNSLYPAFAGCPERPTLTGHWLSFCLFFFPVFLIVRLSGTLKARDRSPVPGKPEERQDDREPEEACNGTFDAEKKTGPRGGAAKGQVGPCGESHRKSEFAGIRTVIPYTSSGLWKNP